MRCIELSTGFLNPKRKAQDRKDDSEGVHDKAVSLLMKKYNAKFTDDDAFAQSSIGNWQGLESFLQLVRGGCDCLAKFVVVALRTGIFRIMALRLL